MTLPLVKLRSLEPLAVLGACKAAAIRDGWLLERWEEFSKTARSCLGADASEEEHRCFMLVVRERFEVHEASPAPTQPAVPPVGGAEVVFPLEQK